MKKWMAGVFVCMILLLCSLYVFIPNTVPLKTNITIKATRPGIHRMLLDKNNVAKWWPGKVSNDSFYFKDFAYKIMESNVTVLPVYITGQSIGLTTSLFLNSILTDSTQLEWVGTLAMPYSPVKRFFAYQKAKKINIDMTFLLKKMETFYSMPANIYGFDIKKELVNDSLLIATAGRCKGYPTSKYIYSLIGKLKDYAATNSGKESGYPMLNISTNDSINFDVKVAIPTNKLLPSSSDIMQKRMLGRGNILTTEVKGGLGTTAQALEQIHIYAEDYQRTAPAIPFFSLITDRLKEPDTSKWVTKIYFPVM